MLIELLYIIPEFVLHMLQISVTQEKLHSKKVKFTMKLIRNRTKKIVFHLKQLWLFNLQHVYSEEL